MMIRILGAAVFIFLADPTSNAWPDNRPKEYETDSALQEWCQKLFENSARYSDRPIGKLGQIDIRKLAAPPNLIQNTEIIGSLPPAISRYAGHWIYPALGSPDFAIFVERLSPTDMTIAILGNRPEMKVGDPNILRKKLKWDGNAFSQNLEGGVRIQIAVSESGKAMIAGAEKREAWAICLISSKVLR